MPDPIPLCCDPPIAPAPSRPPANNNKPKSKEQPATHAPPPPPPPAATTYTGAALDAPANPSPADKVLTKVNHGKKNTYWPLFAPAYSKINRQVMIKTDEGPVLELTDDLILTTINVATTHHNIQVLGAYYFHSGNITLETTPNTSAEEGPTLGLKITAALDSLNVMGDNVFPNSRWL